MKDRTTRVRSSLQGLVFVASLAGLALTSCTEVCRAADPLTQIRAWNAQGRMGEAEKACRSELDRLSRSEGADSMIVAEFLDELAVSLRRSGKAGGAEVMAVCERSVRIRREVVGTDHPRYAASVHQLGMVWFARGDLEAARPLLEEALHIRRRTLGDETADVAASLLAVGAAHSQMGEDSLSLLSISEGVAIQRRVLAPKDPALCIGLNALGATLYRAGAYASAIPVYEEAIERMRKVTPPNRTVLGESFHNLGSLQAEMGQTTEAKRCLLEALRLREHYLGKDHPHVASTLVVLAGLEEEANPSRAFSYYQRALRIRRTALRSDHPDVAWTLVRLGLLHNEQGQHLKARRTLEEAIQLQERSQGADHPDLWLALLGLGVVSAHEGKRQEAEEHFERSLSVLNRAYGPMYVDLAAVHARYASFLLDSGDLERALGHSLRSSKVAREQLRSVTRGLPDRQALLYAAELGAGLDVALSTLEHLDADLPATSEVWDALVRTRCLVLDEVALRTHDAALLEERGQDAWSRLEEARGKLSRILVRGPAGDSVDRYRGLVEAAQTKVDRLERELARALASHRTVREQEGFEEVRASLPEGSSLVSYYVYLRRGEPRLMAFVLDSTRRASAIPLGSAAPIWRAVSAWRQTLTSTDESKPGAAERRCRTRGERVRELVWDPVVTRLGDARLVFLVPDGLLHLVNLSALPESQGYVADSGPTLHHLSSERDLLRKVPDVPPHAKLLVVGGPSFDGTAGHSSSTRHRGSPGDCRDLSSIHFEPLPDAVREAREIAALWPEPAQVRVVTGPNATESGFKQEAQTVSAIHLASHAFVLGDTCAAPGSLKGARGMGGTVGRPILKSKDVSLRENPLRLSGIAFAGANRRAQTRGPEDGILTAEEITSLDLSRTFWAVLSACDTGVGEVRLGEGVLGLRRAFQVAGVGTLVMSLWGVEDRAARQWMSALYRAKFQERVDTAHAVRSANERVLRDRRAQGRSTHPFYWAAFVAAGNWR